MSIPPSGLASADPALRWLERHGFTADPFAEWEASKEDRLQSYFVLLPLFDKLYGDPEQPTTEFLLAARGCGKSAHRIMMQLSAPSPDSQKNVLAVPYVDFISFLDESGSSLRQPPLREHLQLILQNALHVMTNYFCSHPSGWYNLLPDEQGELKAFVLEFAPHLLRSGDLARRLAVQAEPPISARALQDAITVGTLAGFVKEHKLDEISTFAFWSTLLDTAPSSETWPDNLQAFKRFVELARQSGFVAVYVLVDGPDETLGNLSSQTCADFLAPLVTNVPLMQIPNAAFKFFLPRTVGAVLRTNEFARFDRLHITELFWDHDWLNRVLADRLSSFHKDHLDSLSAFAAQSFPSIDQELIRKAQASPRGLILLGHLLLEEHIKADSDPAALLTREDFKNAVRRFDNEFRWRIAAAPPLRVDEKAHKLFLGGHESDVKLSKREFAVLAYLYLSRGMLRTADDIIAAVSYDGNVAFDSMMSRLRAKIEPDPKNAAYLVTQHGRGYRLVNTE